MQTKRGTLDDYRIHLRAFSSRRNSSYQAVASELLSCYARRVTLSGPRPSQSSRKPGTTPCRPADHPNILILLIVTHAVFSNFGNFTFEILLYVSRYMPNAVHLKMSSCAACREYALGGKAGYPSRFNGPGLCNRMRRLQCDCVMDVDIGFERVGM
jgi:hypothetical protein